MRLWQALLDGRIQVIATDAGYLMVCRAIVNDSFHRNQEDIRSIKTVCRIQSLDFQLLQEKLLPAAYVVAEGNDVAPAFLEYARPLIGEPLPLLGRLKRYLV